MALIYNDLRESTYKVKYNELTFVFSSEFYMNNFIDKKDEYLKNELDKLYVKYKTSVYADNIILIELYKKIEKRGFYILKNEKPLKDYYIETILK